MSNRDQRKTRKSGRERSRKHYALKKINEKLNRMLEKDTTPSSPVPGTSGENAVSKRSWSDEGKRIETVWNWK